MKIKKWNGSAWVQEYPEVNVSSIVATGTPSSSTFLRGDGQWAVPSYATGDITGVTAGNGLFGGGTSGDVTLTVGSGTGISVGATTVAIASAYSPNTAIELTSAQNLNDITTAGFYYQTANADTSGNNYPSGEAGSLLVQKSAGLVTQTYTTYSTDPKVYVRTYYTSWSSWVRVFTDNYHPNADTLTTARTIALTGDVTGSASFNGSANISITATVGDDSHTHDGRYYTETEADGRFVNTTGDTMTGNLIMGNNYIYGDLTTTKLRVGSTAEFATVRSMEIRADDDDSSNTEYLKLMAGQNTLQVTSTLGGGTDNSKLTYNGNEVWHAGNDGAGSGLDADTLDGQHASAFAASSHTHTLANITDSNTLVTLSGSQTITGYKTFDGGLKLAVASGTTSDSITFDTAQTYTGPIIRGKVQTLYRDYYLSSYEIADAGNYASVIPGSWTEIKSGETSITSGTSTTNVSITTGTLSADDIIAIEFHTVDVEGTYSTSIQFVKLGSASSSLYSVVMFPSYNSGTSMRISFARVWLASSTSVSFSYSYYGEIDTTPTAQVDTVYVGKIWKINGVTGV